MSDGFVNNVEKNHFKNVIVAITRKTLRFFSQKLNIVCVHMHFWTEKNKFPRTTWAPCSLVTIPVKYIQTLTDHSSTNLHDRILEYIIIYSSKKFSFTISFTTCTINRELKLHCSQTLGAKTKECFIINKSGKSIYRTIHILRVIKKTQTSCNPQKTIARSRCIVFVGVRASEIDSLLKTL